MTIQFVENNMTMTRNAIDRNDEYEQENERRNKRAARTHK